MSLSELLKEQNILTLPNDPPKQLAGTEGLHTLRIEGPVRFCQELLIADDSTETTTSSASTTSMKLTLPQGSSHCERSLREMNL